jgi:HK97 family phage portal protein
MVGLRTAARVGRKVISSKESLEQSAVWAAVRLRADLISTLPIETYQMVDNMRVDSGATPFIGSPEFMEFLYSSQSDLDMHGNAIGVIDSFISNTKIPAHITLKEATSCQVIVKDDIITNYRIDGIEYNPSVIWHEKQFTMAGLHVGLSPVEYAAYTLGQYASVRDFASQWFESGNGPRASLKNTEKKIDSREATIAKESWKATQEMGEPFVHGSNWEYSLIEAQSASNDWITAQQFGLTEAARYFGVPSNLIDAAMSGDHVTYANVVQRNLQFLIMHLGPAIRRRENSLSGLLPKPRNLKFDEDALLRMDPVTRAQMIETKINSRVLAPSEARKADNLPPFTLEQIEEFDALGLNRRNATPQTSLSPMQPEFAGVYAGDIPPTGADEDPIPNAPLPVQPGAKVPPSPTKGNGK